MNLLIQFADSLISKRLVIEKDYHNTMYTRYHNEGFYITKYGDELPTWMAKVYSGALRFNNINVSPYLVKNIRTAVRYIIDNQVRTITFSSMSSNLSLIIELLTELNKYSNYIKIVNIGGYNLQEIKCLLLPPYKYNLSNETIKLHYKGSLLDSDLGTYANYKIFPENTKCIPRVHITAGCSNNCYFCSSIDKHVYRKNPSVFILEVDTMRHLSFKLIYIDDKTFGMDVSANQFSPDLNSYLHHLCKRYPKAKWIVQTHPRTLIEKVDIFDRWKHKIKYIELGVEHVSNTVLALANKNTTISVLNKSMNIIEELYKGRAHKPAIINLIAGLPGSNRRTISNTITWVRKYKPIIHHLNINNLELFHDSFWYIKKNIKNYNIYCKERQHITYGSKNAAEIAAYNRLGLELLSRKLKGKEIKLKLKS